jgi:hypothetical protein
VTCCTRRANLALSGCLQVVDNGLLDKHREYAIIRCDGALTVSSSRSPCRTLVRPLRSTTNESALGQIVHAAPHEVSAGDARKRSADQSFFLTFLETIRTLKKNGDDHVRSFETAVSPRLAVAARTRRAVRGFSPRGGARRRSRPHARHGAADHPWDRSANPAYGFGRTLIDAAC